jgi:hypothetical protein
MRYTYRSDLTEYATERKPAILRGIVRMTSMSRDEVVEGKLNEVRSETGRGASQQRRVLEPEDA